MNGESGKVKKSSSSCAECKRLKMKCDRNVPCGSCEKRGLTSLCPNGTLRPGKGSRYILASTEDLHSKLDQLLERTRALEVALDASHQLHSTQTHDLLKKEFLVEGSRLALEKDHDEEEEVPVAAFGTLKISQKTGGSEWIGSTGASYFFAVQEEDDAGSGLASVETLSESEAMLQRMLSYLPEKPEAWSLLETYHENFTWNYNPVPRTILIKDFLKPAYEFPPPSLHHLSVLFSMFSLGALMDLARSPNSEEAKTYREVAKIPLDIETISKDTSLVTIEALIMYAQAIQWSDDPNGPALTWTYLTLCVTLGESIGLHRDPKSWNMDDATTLRRRRVFWELMYMATWQCLIHGRPPLLTQRHIDIQLPEEETEETMGTDPRSHLWRYRWTKELGWPTADQLLSPSYPPTHALVMKIDKKIREFSFPWDVDAKIPEGDPNGVLRDFENLMMNGILELNAMHVHRGFFAHALVQNPTNPLNTKFMESVLSAYGAASRIIQRAQDYYGRRPEIMGRASIMYSHAFSATIVVGAIATQSPQCPLAAAALRDLDTACGIFNTGKDNIRVAKILYIVKRLQAKARTAFQQQRLGGKQAPSDDSSDLPGIIGAPAVVTGGSRSSDGSPAAHSNSPPGESPPSLGHYDEHTAHSSSGDRTSPQYETKPVLEEYWYSQAQHGGPILRGNPMEVASQYGSYGSYAPEIYDPSNQHVSLVPSTQSVAPVGSIPPIARTIPSQGVQKVSPQTSQINELYGWPHEDRGTVTVVPASYHSHEPPPAMIHQGPYANANSQVHQQVDSYQSNYPNPYHSYYSSAAHNQSQAPSHNQGHHGHGHGHTHSHSHVHGYSSAPAHGHGHSHTHSHSYSQLPHAQAHGHGHPQEIQEDMVPDQNWNTFLGTFLS